MGWYCVDCREKKNTGGGERCRSCASKRRWADPSFKQAVSRLISDTVKKRHKEGKYLNSKPRRRRKTKEPNRCIDCGKAIDRGSTRCWDCYNECRLANRRRNYCIDCGKEISLRAERCLSCALKEQWARGLHRELFSEEAIAKNAAVRREMWADPELRKKASEVQCSAWSNPELKIRHSQIMSEVQRRPGVAEKREKAYQDWIASGGLTDESRAKISEGVKAAWARGDFENIVRNPSNLALMISRGLEKLGYIYELEFRVSGYAFDIYIPLLNLLIEIDGWYWHHSKRAIERGVPERDARKEQLAITQGYKFVRISERDVQTLGVDEVIQEVLITCAK